MKSVAFKLDYDPELVTVADAELGADLPDTAESLSGTLRQKTERKPTLQ